MAFVAKKQWQMQYYVNLVGIGCMEDVERVKRGQIGLQYILDVRNAKGVIKP